MSNTLREIQSCSFAYKIIIQFIICVKDQKSFILLSELIPDDEHYHCNSKERKREAKKGL